MKLYRHYKNKFYKYIDTVRHSETREELALYECLYDSPGGKVWVRPKAMFFENIEVNGKTVARFAPAELEVKEFTSLDREQIHEFAPIAAKVLGNWNEAKFHITREKHQIFHLSVAYIDAQPVGFKLGYARDRSTFYSWMGGILPERRGYGIATRLMQLQHAWCAQNGYTRVETKTQNNFRDMLILNLRSGFEVTGTEVNEDGVLKIILSKNLSSQ